MKTYIAILLSDQAIIKRFSRIFLTGVLLSFLFYPKAGAQELDVPYVSTPQTVVEKMLDVADVGPGDYVIDLGCGDGRIVVAAARRGAYGHGIDLDPKRIREARENARTAGVEGQVMFLKEDIFKTDFSRANVITMYLLSSINLKLRPKLLKKLEPGTKIVSHNFDMGDWEPDKHIRLDDREFLPGGQDLVAEPAEKDTQKFTTDNWVVEKPVDIDTQDFDLGDWMINEHIKLDELKIQLEPQAILEPIGLRNHDIYYWIIPARVEGKWQWEINGFKYTMKADQHFQKINLTLHTGNDSYRIERSELSGKRIGFTVVNPQNGNRYVYNGRVDGDEIMGKVQIHGNHSKTIKNWSAVKK
jgi:SAM-dependent methyltransferase